VRAVENGLNLVLAHGEVALMFFDFDRGVVDEDADGEREAAEGHDMMVSPRALRRRTLTRSKAESKLKMMSVLFSCRRKRRS